MRVCVGEISSEVVIVESLLLCLSVYLCIYMHISRLRTVLSAVITIFVTIII